MSPPGGGRSTTSATERRCPRRAAGASGLARRAAACCCCLARCLLSPSSLPALRGRAPCRPATTWAAASSPAAAPVALGRGRADEGRGCSSARGGPRGSGSGSGCGCSTPPCCVARRRAPGAPVSWLPPAGVAAGCATGTARLGPLRRSWTSRGISIPCSCALARNAGISMISRGDGRCSTCCAIQAPRQYGDRQDQRWKGQHAGKHSARTDRVRQALTQACTSLEYCVGMGRYVARMICWKS